MRAPPCLPRTPAFATNRSAISADYATAGAVGMPPFKLFLAVSNPAQLGAETELPAFVTGASKLLKPGVLRIVGFASRSINEGTARFCFCLLTEETAEMLCSPADCAIAWVLPKRRTPITRRRIFSCVNMIEPCRCGGWRHTTSQIQQRQAAPRRLNLPLSRVASIPDKSQSNVSFSTKHDTNTPDSALKAPSRFAPTLRPVPQ